MSEFSFFATLDDRPSLLRALMARPELVWFRAGNYSSPKPERVSDGTITAFVTNELGQIYGLWAAGKEPEMRMIVKGQAAGTWFIDTSPDISMIACSLPVHYAEDGWRLGAGNLYYPASGVPASADPSLRGMYGVLKDDLRTLLISKKVGGRRVLMTHSAAALFEEGAKVRIDGKWIESTPP